MLVLSRRETGKILFPTLGISVKVVKVQGRKSRLGINAPQDVPLIRHEWATRKCAADRLVGSCMEFTSDLYQSNQRLGELISLINHRLDSAASILNRLKGAVDADQEAESE